MVKLKIFVLFFVIFQQSCANTNTNPQNTPKIKATKISNIKIKQPIIPAAERLDTYLSLLKDKRVAMVVNQTSMIENTHLVDSLLSEGIQITKVFAPEHGFRGKADAGEKLKDGFDVKTNLPIISLYGKHRKPYPEDLENIEVVVFDVQDVGARFYTYISTMTLVMEACAEKGIPFIVLDRPNPIGHYVDGPVRQEKWTSFVGMHPIPIVHGMTVGELAQMINQEGWLKNEIKCDLQVIKCKNYTHQSFYELPIKPSPNLPNIRSIYLYPSLCLFEGTTISIGRGTNQQFQLFGHPDLQGFEYEFTPISREGAKYPKHENKLCFGENLTTIPLDSLQKEVKFNLNYMLKAYAAFPDKAHFFNDNNFFEKLAGNGDLRQQIKDGLSAEDIRETWKSDLEKFKALRARYLLYK